ncbi:MAG: hypothetical protein L3J71_10715 [Victivallaceae bacterium]|nr:hypothetical protein [Victivallaceae bacterium]
MSITGGAGTENSKHNREFISDKKLDPAETCNRAGLSFYDDKLKAMRSVMTII